MTFDVAALFTENLTQKFELADRYFNPTFVQALKLVGLNNLYARAQGCYVYDNEGHRYLDFLCGYRVLSLGHNHPVVRQALMDGLPDCGWVPFNDADALEGTLKAGDVGAFIVEPLQGEAGFVVPSDDYLPRAQELCRFYGTLFVLDEVQTGLGRTGKFLAAEHWNLQPDMICLAKALSGGFVPVSATLMRRSIFLKVFN